MLRTSGGMEIDKMSKIEQFCDILSVTPSIVDEGYFTKSGFYSNTKCRCKIRSEHYDNCLIR